MNQQAIKPAPLTYPRTKLRLSRSVIRDIDQLLANMRQQASQGLHIGAGSIKLPGLTNCDLFNPDADVKADATKLDMFGDGTVDLIESNHMIEHLSFADTDLALAEWRRVLCEGGLLVLTFPDITAIAVKWLKYAWVYPLLPRPQKMDYMVKMLVGSQEHDGMFHRNAFDLRRMERILSSHGFSIEFTHCRYPRRPTPSRLVIARKH